MNYNRSAEELYKQTLIQDLLYVGVTNLNCNSVRNYSVGELRALQIFCLTFSYHFSYYMKAAMFIMLSEKFISVISSFI